MRAPQPEPPIPGSFATPSLLAWIVNGKYVMSLPLYRIEADLKACGATISRQDMANWMMNVHARWCISSSRCFVFEVVTFSWTP